MQNLTVRWTEAEFDAELLALAQDQRQVDSLCGYVDFLDNTVLMNALRRESLERAVVLVQLNYKKEGQLFAELARCIEGAFIEFGRSPSLFNNFANGVGSSDALAPIAIFSNLQKSVAQKLAHKSSSLGAERKAVS